MLSFHQWPYVCGFAGSLYVTRLMKEEGVIEKDHQPTDEEVRRYDKQRKNKKVSNQDWVSTSDPQSEITQMKDGRTHLASRTLVHIQCIYQ